MKIKLKMKHLILIALGTLIIIFIVIPFATIEIADTLPWDKKDLAKGLYEKYINYPTGGRKGEAIFKKSQLLVEDLGRHTITLNGSGGGASINMEEMEEVIEGYEVILKEYPDDEYYEKAYKNIMDSYIYLGSDSELENWIEWGRSGEVNIREISKIYNAYRSYLNRDYNQSEKILETIDRENETIEKLYFNLKGDIAFNEEKYDLAREYYEKIEDSFGLEDRFIHRSSSIDRKFWLKSATFLKGENKISGRVTSDGEGMAFVEVYLKKPHSGFMTGGENYIAITDSEGYYETPGVKSGEYDIGIGVATPLLYDKVYLRKNIEKRKIDVDENLNMDFQFVSPMEIIEPQNGTVVKDGKFKVKWKEVEGADYYSVFMIGFEDPEKMKGSSVTTVIEDENGKTDIKGTQAVFDLQKLRDSSRGGFIVNEDVASSTTILGYFFPGIEVPIIVNAYDREGNMLGSTMPKMSYYEDVPSVVIDDRELTEGEKLLQDMRYEEAISHYKQALKDDPRHLEALENLTKINSVNWKKDKKDIKASLEYAKEYYKYGGEKDVIYRILIEIEADEIRENKDLILEMLEHTKEERLDIYYDRGRIYRETGEWEKARDEFLKSEMDYVNDEVIFMDIYLGDEDLAIERLKNGDVSPDYMNKENLIKGIQGLSEMDREDEEYKEFRDFLMRFFSREIHFEDRGEEYRKIYDAINNKNIRMILKEIERDHYF